MLPRKSASERKQPIRHYQVGVRYRKRISFQLQITIYIGVQVSGCKEDRAHIKEDRGQYSQKIQTEVYYREG